MLVKGAHLPHGRRVAGAGPGVGDLSDPGIGRHRHHLLAEHPAALPLIAPIFLAFGRRLDREDAIAFVGAEHAQKCVPPSALFAHLNQGFGLVRLRRNGFVGLGALWRHREIGPALRSADVVTASEVVAMMKERMMALGSLQVAMLASGSSAGGSIGAELDAGTLAPVAISFYKIV
jgi:hypothetical protein